MSTSNNSKKLNSDRGKAAQQQGNKSTFVRKNIDSFDVLNSVEDPDAVSDSSTSHLKSVALLPRPDYSMQNGSKQMFGRSRNNNAAGSFGFPSGMKDPPLSAKNMLPQPGEKGAAMANTERSVLSSSSSHLKATSIPSTADVPLTRAGHNFQSGSDGDAVILGEEPVERCPQGATSSFFRKGNKPRRYREKLHAHDNFAVFSNNSSQGGDKRRARRHRVKARLCNADLTRASGLDMGLQRNHRRYRDKINKRSSESPHTLEPYHSNAQEPLGAPEDPDQYFGVAEPDLDLDATPPPESTVEEIVPGAVSVSMAGGARPLRKGHLTVLSNPADDNSYLVAMCAIENEFEDESLHSSLKPRMWCGTRMKLALGMLVIAAIAIGVAVSLLLSKQAPVDNDGRREAVQAVISKVTDTAMLYQEGSPQNMAFEWIVNEDELSPIGNTMNAEELRRLIQRYALAVFFYATVDDDRSRLKSHECHWKFVSCDVFGTVMSIEVFDENFLSVSIPREIGILSSIRKLRISSYNLLSIPTEIGLLTNLVNLTLSNTLLTGWFPNELFSLSQLRVLVFSGNKLAGSIPANNISKFSQLAYLDLSGNELAGSIPTEVSELTQLGALMLSENQLTGSIPTEFSDLTELRELNLSNNQLTGFIPTELSELTQLGALGLWENQLTGSIPTELSELTQLGALSLWENQLTGSIPTELSELTQLEALFLSGNQLTGSIPTELSELTQLKKLILWKNQLTGSIPTELSELTQLDHTDRSTRFVGESAHWIYLNRVNKPHSVTIFGVEQQSPHWIYPDRVFWSL